MLIMSRKLTKTGQNDYVKLKDFIAFAFAGKDSK